MLALQDPEVKKFSWSAYWEDTAAAISSIGACAQAAFAQWGQSAATAATFTCAYTGDALMCMGCTASTAITPMCRGLWNVLQWCGFAAAKMMRRALKALVSYGPAAVAFVIAFVSYSLLFTIAAFAWCVVAVVKADVISRMVLRTIVTAFAWCVFAVALLMAISPYYSPGLFEQ